MNDDKMEDFQTIKLEMEKYCEKYGIPIPTIIPSDALDNGGHVTDPEAGEIHVDVYDMDNPLYCAKHIFGHYMADFHTLGNGESDLIADAIAHLIENDK